MTADARVRVWVAAAALVTLPGCGRADASLPGVAVDFSYVNTLSHTEQRAAGYVPSVNARQPCPLLVVAHYAGGTRFTARDMGYYDECEKRGWICACPQLHGETFVKRGAFGSRESQHDILDVIAYMRAHYRVDTTRIYLVGRSMGGQTAQLMAAKCPDLFAAVISGEGISDLKAWVDSIPDFRGYIESFACGRYSDTTAFEYARRSPVNYAPNFQYVPIVLWHGTADRIVPPAQTAEIAKRIAVYTPYQAPVHWLLGSAHESANYGPSWECEQLAPYQNMSDKKIAVSGRYFGALELVTDEDKPFFWVDLARRDSMAFGRVRASIAHDTLFVHAENLSRVTVLTSRLAKGTDVKAYRVEADGPLELVRASGDGRAGRVSVVRGGSGTFGP